MHLIGQPAPHVQRMLEEGDQLSGRLGKLATFIGSAIYEELPPVKKALMQAQMAAMTAYLNILQLRVMAEIGPKNGSIENG